MYKEVRVVWWVRDTLRSSSAHELPDAHNKPNDMNTDESVPVDHNSALKAAIISECYHLEDLETQDRVK